MNEIYKRVRTCRGFEWDAHNINKNWEKHHVSPVESEQIFFNYPLVIAADIKHSEAEDRCFALGKTDRNRTLFVVFTIRDSNIRVISSRDMSRKERAEYEKHNEKENPGI